MVRIFITGSSDGIGLQTAQSLISHGHSVVVHARNEDRAETTRKALPKVEAVLIGDLSSIAQTVKLAEDANALSEAPFDVIIHNAGIYSSSTPKTTDKIATVFAVNSLAPYILTCLTKRPTTRVAFMSSESHYGSDPSLRNATQSNSYGNSKLHDTMLANAFGRRWGKEIQVVSIHPGWVPTKMGGEEAPDSLNATIRFLSDWAEGKSPFNTVKSGTLFTFDGVMKQKFGAENVTKQEELLKICQDVSGVSVPS